MAAKAGDRIIVESEKVGTPARDGEILEVIASPLGVRYRVRWADGHESTFRPSAGSSRIVPARRSKAGVSRRRPVPPGPDETDTSQRGLGSAPEPADAILELILRLEQATSAARRGDGSARRCDDSALIRR